jgi:hypothetical protein
VFAVPDSSDSAFASACGNPAQAKCTAWFAGQHLRRQISYQPASRFWQIQAEETGILLAISVHWPAPSPGKSGIPPMTAARRTTMGRHRGPPRRR